MGAFLSLHSGLSISCQIAVCFHYVRYSGVSYFQGRFRLGGRVLNNKKQCRNKSFLLQNSSYLLQWLGKCTYARTHVHLYQSVSRFKVHSQPISRLLTWDSRAFPWATLLIPAVFSSPRLGVRICYWKRPGRLQAVLRWGQCPLAKNWSATNVQSFETEETWAAVFQMWAAWDPVFLRRKKNDNEEVHYNSTSVLKIRWSTSRWYWTGDFGGFLFPSHPVCFCEGGNSVHNTLIPNVNRSGTRTCWWSVKYCTQHDHVRCSLLREGHCWISGSRAQGKAAMWHGAAHLIWEIRPHIAMARHLSTWVIGKSWFH